jgi:hypothetical protein
MTWQMQDPMGETTSATHAYLAGDDLLGVGLGDGVGVERVHDGVQLSDRSGERVAGVAEPMWVPAAS